MCTWPKAVNCRSLGNSCTEPSTWKDVYRSTQKTLLSKRSFVCSSGLLARSEHLLVQQGQHSRQAHNSSSRRCVSWKNCTGISTCAQLPLRTLQRIRLPFSQAQQLSSMCRALQQGLQQGDNPQDLAHLTCKHRTSCVEIRSLLATSSSYCQSLMTCRMFCVHCCVGSCRSTQAASVWRQGLCWECCLQRGSQNRTSCGVYHTLR